MGAYRTELDHAVTVSVQAAAEILRRYEKSDWEVRYKTPIEPVTEADMVADQILREYLTGAFPADGWLSEETRDDGERHRRARVWIVDPLDGTREFLAGRPEFRVSVALVAGGVPVVGVIVDPVGGGVWSAERGCGAHRNGSPIHVTDTSDLSRAEILVSRTEHTGGLLTAFEGRFPIRPAGGMANKLALVAEGRADGTFTSHRRCEWDAAAGLLILSEAGGTVTDLSGRALAFNQTDPSFVGVVASNGLLHEGLRAAIE